MLIASLPPGELGVILAIVTVVLVALFLTVCYIITH